MKYKISRIKDYGTVCQRVFEILKLNFLNNYNVIFYNELISLLYMEINKTTVNLKGFKVDALKSDFRINLLIRL